MFIAHGAWVRRNLRWLMAAILVVLIPGFVVLFTRTDVAGRRAGQWPTIRGKPVNPAELQNAEAAVRAQYLLSSGGKLPRTPQAEDALTKHAVIRLVLLRKAREFGIQISDDELVRLIQAQPMFRSDNGQFDPDRYRQLLIRLNNSEVSELQFEEMMRQQFIIQRLEDLIGTGAVVTPTELTLAYTPLHEKAVGEYVVFDAATAVAPPAVSDADAQAFFEKHSQQFRLPPEVKVRYARFAFATAKQAAAVTDKDISEFYERNQTAYTNGLAAAKAEIRQQLAQMHAQRSAGDRATELTVKLVPEGDAPPPDFAKLAAQFGGEIKETGFFALHDSVPGIPPDTQFNQIAFTLTADSPYSDPVEAPAAYYVLALLAAKPSLVPPFDQVKQRVIDRLQHERALEATIKQGKDAVTKLKDLMAKGRTFAQACADLHLTPKTAAPFSFVEETPELPAAEAVKEAVLSLPVNGVSEFLRTASGGVTFHLSRRLPPDPAKFAADRAKFSQELRREEQQALWEAWADDVMRSEQVDFHLQASAAPPATTPAAPDEEEPTPPTPAPAGQ